MRGTAEVVFLDRLQYDASCIDRRLRSSSMHAAWRPTAPCGCRLCAAPASVLKRFEQVRTYGFGGGARFGMVDGRRVVVTRYYHLKAPETDTGEGMDWQADNSLGARLDPAHDWDLENDIHNRLEQAGMPSEGGSKIRSNRQE